MEIRELKTAQIDQTTQGAICVISELKDPVLIVGGGPTGLAAACELSRLGVPVRVIEKAPERAGISKALGINARTLEVLEPCGVTALLLERARKVHEICFRKGEKTLWKIDFNSIEHPYQFILVQPQHETEECIEERLISYGGKVERGVELVDFTDLGDSVECKLKKGDETENFKASFLFGGDGAHSFVRHKLEVPFPGHREDAPWSLADLELEWNLDSPEVNIFFVPEGVLFFMRIKDNVFRLAANQPGLLDRLPPSIKVNKVIWETDFTVSHRLVSSYAKGNVYLGGDAAHLHSPLGGRGMNLGIEDGVSFARMVSSGALQAYPAQRLEAGKKTVAMVNRLTRMTTLANPVLRAARNTVVPLVMKMPKVRKKAATEMSGLA